MEKPSFESSQSDSRACAFHYHKSWLPISTLIAFFLSRQVEHLIVPFLGQEEE